MKAKIKKIDPRAQLPRKAHDTDFCYDVAAVSEREIAPNVWKYGTGLAIQVERDSETEGLGVAIDARPRSSVWKTGMVLSNCVGTIDEGYTGEICAVFYHVLPWMPRYKTGDRILQIKLGTAMPLEFVETEELDKTERGDGGYGSTGR